MRCSKSCYLYDLELVDLFENTVIEQVYYKNLADKEGKKARPIRMRFKRTVFFIPDIR